MASTLNTHNHASQGRAIARECPTPHLQRPHPRSETRPLGWAEVAEIFRASLAKGLTEVAA